jgi:Mrp family chromosome partitioning ATPase
MTTLNQACLRAYERERSTTPASSSASSHASSPASSPASFSSAPLSATPVAAPPASMHPTSITIQHAAAAGSPAGHHFAGPVISDASKAVEPSASAPFTAAWEADELPWSEVCDRLRDESGPELLVAIARWRSAMQGGPADEERWPGPLVLGVTSLIRREGRTTVAAGLARAAVAAGLRVALMDADLENPRLSSAAEVAIDATWVDCVVGDAPLSEAAIRCPADGFHLFPLGGSARHSAFQWNAMAALRMFRALRRHFDLCLLDMGPLTDALKRGLQGGVDSPLDGVLLLRDVRITGADQVLLIARELHQAGLPIVGVVDNFNDSSEHSRCMKATGS